MFHISVTGNITDALNRYQHSRAIYMRNNKTRPKEDTNCTVYKGPFRLKYDATSLRRVLSKKGPSLLEFR